MNLNKIIETILKKFLWLWLPVYALYYLVKELFFAKK